MIRYIDAGHCPHPRPDEDTDAWDEWDDWHQPAFGIARICLLTPTLDADAPSDELTLAAMNAYSGGQEEISLDAFDPDSVVGVREAVAAVIPLIREQVAREIETNTDPSPLSSEQSGVNNAWIDSRDCTKAARIARGES